MSQQSQQDGVNHGVPHNGNLWGFDLQLIEDFMDNLDLEGYIAEMDLEVFGELEPQEDEASIARETDSSEDEEVYGQDDEDDE
ncbi:hypothetical protein BGX27_002111 [Mortierella sp. AM989]|nr:hypothetical protein BGX27_002111 [Mortierella sp. AM989]